MGWGIAIPAAQCQADVRSGYHPCVAHLHWHMTSALAEMRSWEGRRGANKHEGRLARGSAAEMANIPLHILGSRRKQLGAKGSSRPYFLT